MQTEWFWASRGHWYVALWIGDAAMALAIPFAMVLVASTPLLPMWPTGLILVLVGSTFSNPMGHTPGSIYGWSAMATIEARSERVETGQIGRSSIAPVGTSGF